MGSQFDKTKKSLLFHPPQVQAKSLLAPRPFAEPPQTQPISPTSPNRAAPSQAVIPASHNLLARVTATPVTEFTPKLQPKRLSGICEQQPVQPKLKAIPHQPSLQMSSEVPTIQKTGDSNTKVPGVDLERDIINNPIIWAKFKSFAAKEYNSENIDCYEAIQAFKKSPSLEMAQSIVTTYFPKNRDVKGSIDDESNPDEVNLQNQNSEPVLAKIKAVENGNQQISSDLFNKCVPDLILNLSDVYARFEQKNGLIGSMIKSSRRSPKDKFKRLLQVVELGQKDGGWTNAIKSGAKYIGKSVKRIGQHKKTKENLGL